MPRPLFSNPWSTLAADMSRLYWDATFVMARRTGDMARGKITAAEWQRMVAEKPFAMMSAIQSGSGALMMGGHPAHVAGSAMKPIRLRATENARRLRKKTIAAPSSVRYVPLS